MASNPPALFIPTTGRPLDSVRRTFSRHMLYVGEKIPLPMVLQNGSQLLDGNEVLLDYSPFEPSLQKDLISLSMRFKDVTFLFLSADDIYILWPNPFGTKSVNGFEVTLRDFSDRNRDFPFSKIMCISESYATLRTLADSFNSWPVKSAYCMSTILEITPKNVNKGRGLMKLLHMLNKEDQPVYVAGDGENDLAMFHIAKSSFAPINAPENKKAAASQIIDVSLEGLISPILKIAG